MRNLEKGLDLPSGTAQAGYMTTTTNHPPTVDLTVCGPNLPGTNTAGSIHVHAAGCRDLAKTLYRRTRDHQWTEDFTDALEVVTTVYPPSDFNYDPTIEAELAPYADDVTIFPCVVFPEPVADVTPGPAPVPDPKPVAPVSVTPDPEPVRSGPIVTDATVVCPVCHHDLAQDKFPTKPADKNGQIDRNYKECRKCRDFRKEGKAIGRPASVPRPGNVPAILPEWLAA